MRYVFTHEYISNGTMQPIMQHLDIGLRSIGYLLICGQKQP